MKIYLDFCCLNRPYNDEERRQRIRSLVSHASEFVSVKRKTHARAKEIQEQLGVKTYDALHLACAEQGKANVFYQQAISL